MTCSRVSLWLLLGSGDLQIGSPPLKRLGPGATGPAHPSFAARKHLPRLAVVAMNPHIGQPLEALVPCRPVPACPCGLSSGLRLLDNTLNPFQGESRNPCSLKPAQATRKCILLGLHTEHPAHQLLGGVSHRHRHGCRTRQRRTRGLVAHCSHAHRMPSIHLPQKTC